MGNELIRSPKAFKWSPKFTIRARTCCLTNQKIPGFSTAFKGEYQINGPGTPVVIFAWASSEGYLLARIKGEI